MGEGLVWKESMRMRTSLRRVLFSPRVWSWLAPLVLLLAAKTGAAVEHPVMMESNGPGSELYVLDETGTLDEFRVTDNGLVEYGHFSMPPDFIASDMSFAQTESPHSLLIAGTQSGRGVVLRISLDSKTLQTWTFQNVCAGVDSGAHAAVAYVATSDSNEIFRINLKGTGITSVARISDASKLGPVAFDEAQQEIYVADVASGQIYQYSLTTRSSRIFVTHLSAPTALVFDPESNRLFIADPGQQSIFVADTRAAKPVAVSFASTPLKSPYGMTLISQDRVAVADHSSSSIFVFSSKGALLFRFPAR
jgi:DNA-binding beta-propeller fold protein YncE